MEKEKIGGSFQTNIEQKLGVSFENFLRLEYEDQQKLIEKLNDYENKTNEPKVKKFSLFRITK